MGAQSSCHFVSFTQSQLHMSITEGKHLCVCSNHVTLLSVEALLNTLQSHPPDGDLGLHCVSTTALPEVVGGVHDFAIVNFPYLSSNIPSGPAYGVYISQLVRIGRICSNYSQFTMRHYKLTQRLIHQGFRYSSIAMYSLLEICKETYTSFG